MLALTEGWPWWGVALFAIVIVIGVVVVVKAILARL